MKKLSLILALMLGVALGAFAQTNNSPETYTPGDTIMLKATNMALTDNTSSSEPDFSISAFTNDFKIAIIVRTDHVEGTFTEADLLMGALILDVTGETKYLTVVTADFTVRLEEDNVHYAVTGTFTTNDGSTFIIDFTYRKPEKSRSLDLVFYADSTTYSNSFDAYSVVGITADSKYALTLFYDGKVDAPTGVNGYTILNFDTADTHDLFFIVDGEITATCKGDSIVYAGKLLFQNAYAPDDVPEVTFTLYSAYKSEAHTSGSTIQFTATNLDFLDDTSSSRPSFSFTAYTADYQIIAVILSDHVEGTYTENDLYKQLSAMLDNNSDDILYITKADLTVRLAEDSVHYVITGTVTTDDGSTFILDLSFTLPEKTRTMDIVFYSGPTEYYEDEDLYYSTGYNDDKSISLELYYSGMADSPSEINRYGTMLYENTGNSIDDVVIYEFVDGEVDVTCENGNIVYTGTFLMQNAYDPEDVPELHFTMYGTYNPEDDPKTIVILPAIEDAPLAMPMYDLNGRPVTDSRHGIVIQNGKKYLR